MIIGWKANWHQQDSALVHARRTRSVLEYRTEMYPRTAYQVTVPFLTLSELRTFGSARSTFRICLHVSSEKSPLHRRDRADWLSVNTDEAHRLEVAKGVNREPTSLISLLCSLKITCTRDIERFGIQGPQSSLICIPDESHCTPYLIWASLSRLSSARNHPGF
jgi:hypothetical protein